MYSTQAGFVKKLQVEYRPRVPEGCCLLLCFNGCHSLNCGTWVILYFCPHYWCSSTHNDNVVFLTDSDSGAISLKRELPHTITEWTGTTVCVSPQFGLGISSPTHVTAFQPFFLDYTMPYSIKRGEVVQLKVSLFNFLSYSLPVSLIIV
jgi:hypothetical protein